MLHLFCYWASIYRMAFHFPDFDDLAAGLYAAHQQFFFVVVVGGVLKGCFGCGNSRDYVLTLIRVAALLYIGIHMHVFLSIKTSMS